MCGMVGSDRGWRDAGYREAPTAMHPGPEDLVEVALPGHPAYLVPGIKQHHPAPDVMRGEETQVLGALLEVAGAQDRPPPGALLRGLDLAFGEGRASLSRHLFRARSGLVLGDLAPAEVHDFLSGLLIGDEVADALALLTPDRDVPVLLIASEQLAPRYRAALGRAGLRVRHVDSS